MSALGTPCISDEEIEILDRLASSATKGPWVSYIEGREKISGSSFIMTGGEDIYLSGATEIDQDFIAVARNNVPLLINEIKRLRDMISFNK